MSYDDWKPRLVALDIDGTLVDRDGHLSDEMREAVARVVAAGVPVVVCTGRVWSDTKPLIDDLGLPPGHVICCNGAIWLEYPPLEMHDVATFDPHDVIARVLELHPTALIAVEEIGVGFRVNKPFPNGDLHGRITVVPVAELQAEPVTRLIIRDPDANVSDFLQLAEDLGLRGVSFSVGWSAWLDIAPEGVNKATALARVATRLGVARTDVLAMGDGRNDIEMIAWAGRGIAVGDAPWEVQQAADAVAANYEDHGPALELNRWFPEEAR